MGFLADLLPPPRPDRAEPPPAAVAEASSADAAFRARADGKRLHPDAARPVAGVVRPPGPGGRRSRRHGPPPQLRAMPDLPRAEGGPVMASPRTPAELAALAVLMRGHAGHERRRASELRGVLRSPALVHSPAQRADLQVSISLHDRAADRADASAAHFDQAASRPSLPPPLPGGDRTERNPS